MKAAAKDGKLEHFDAEQAFLEASVDEEMDSRGVSGVSGGSTVAEQGGLQARTGGKALVQILQRQNCDRVRVMKSGSMLVSQGQ